MKTLHAPAYVITNMPRHGDSILAIAYNPAIDPLKLSDLSKYIEALKNENFDIANDAYQGIRNFKINGLITDYAVATTTVEALKELNLRLPKYPLLEIGKELLGGWSSQLNNLYIYLCARHNKHQIFP